MSPSHGVGPAASLRRARGWESVGERSRSIGRGLDPQGGVRAMGRADIHKEKGVRSMETGQTCGKSQIHRERGPRPTDRQG